MSVKIGNNIGIGKFKASITVICHAVSLPWNNEAMGLVTKLAFVECIKVQKIGCLYICDGSFILSL